MEKYAFTMHLLPGKQVEYKSRHDAIWPELVELLRSAGVSDYSIHLDQKTGTLFGSLTRKSDHTMDQLPRDQIMQRWWDHMADIMETDPNNEPIAVPLEPMFYMP